MEYQLKGVIKKIMNEQIISESFSKREFVVYTDEDYPQDIKLEFIKDKCGILDSYKNGDFVNVSFNLRGREWTNPKGEQVYFITLQAWRIENLTPQTSKEDSNNSLSVNPNNGEEIDDDLPF